MADEAVFKQTPPAEPTLEDVYKTVEAEQPVTQVQPQTPSAPQYTPPPQQQPQTVTPQVPDPYDSENFKAYMAQQAQGNAATQEAIKQLAGFISQQQMKEAQAALQKDLSAAVETVNAVVNHPKPKVIEAMLDAKAREDVRFKSLWENRGRNPTAWTNALKAVSREFANDLSLRVDPALADAQRARKLAQSKMATTDAPQSDLEEWESMSVEEQQARMDRMLNSGM